MNRDMHSSHRNKTKNHDCTCWNCPALALAEQRDTQTVHRANGGTGNKNDSSEPEVMAACDRRPELGYFDPSTVTFEDCPEWELSDHGYKLKNMRVMILGIDGYLGWTLALYLGSRGAKISGIDNYSRRSRVGEKNSQSIVPISAMDERITVARDKLGIDIEFQQIDMAERSKLEAFIQTQDPEAIVHYAENPSAPYSMVDAEHAISVQKNNVLGTLGLLFMIRDLVPETSLIKLGTMGEYGTPLSGRPLFEGMFPEDAILQWQGQEWSLGGELTPRDPSSFYHASKVQDTINIFKACKFWGLRSYDVMQGIIFGVHTPHVAADPRLSTRYDVDEWFGTVINRFVAQAVLEMPLTIYGSGEQIRGFIALQDAMQAMTRLVFSPPKPGQYGVVNQISGYYKIIDLARTVAKVGRQEFKLDVEVHRVENPRVEANHHPFNPVFENLPKQFGFEPEVSLEEEIYRMFERLIQPQVRERIQGLKAHILPRTRWSGNHREVEVLDSVDVEPNN